jgi:hypothetical protein
MVCRTSHLLKGGLSRYGLVMSPGVGRPGLIPQRYFAGGLAARRAPWSSEGMIAVSFVAVLRKSAPSNHRGVERSDDEAACPSHLAGDAERLVARRCRSRRSPAPRPTACRSRTSTYWAVARRPASRRVTVRPHWERPRGRPGDLLGFGSKCLPGYRRPNLGLDERQRR